MEIIRLAWLVKATPFFPKTVRTIKNGFGELVGYFERKTTNGLIEGINNRLKVLKRCAFGFKCLPSQCHRPILIEMGH